MNTSDHILRMHADNLALHYASHVAQLALPDDAKPMALAVGSVAIKLWCWQRDGKEVEVTPESLDWLTRQDGVCRITQMLKRRGLPQELASEALRVLEDHGKPADEGPPFAKWINRLHGLCMSSFASSLGPAAA
jgi:hypothetical protein